MNLGGYQAAIRERIKLAEKLRIGKWSMGDIEKFKKLEADIAIFLNSKPMSPIIK